MRLTGLAGFSDLTILSQLGETIILRARNGDGASVVIKTHAADLPTTDIRERFHREHDITSVARSRHISEAMVVIDQPHRSALVLTDHGEISLRELLADSTLDLLGVLEIAVDIAEALATLHAGGVTHRAVDADHIMLTGDDAVLVDLYDACPIGQRPRRMTHGAHPAPEQGAAVLAPARAESDQFALAATISDAIDRLQLDAPPSLRDVLRHASNPDPRHRYRSMFGLRADLIAARDSLRDLGSCPELAITTDCATTAWDDSPQLVGRAEVLAELVAHIDDVADTGNARVIVVRSVPGMGRSSLIANLCDELAERAIVSGLGRFIDGGPTPPLHAPIEMMQQVVSLLLAAPEELIDRVRREMTERVGSDLALAVQVIPPLGLLVGAQPESIEGPPEALIERIERAVQAAIASISQCVAPMVAAFDDADRGDTTALRTLELLASAPDVGPLALVLTAPLKSPRLDEVLERLRRDGTDVREIALGPLSRASIRTLIADGTGSEPHVVGPIADAVFARSGGSPTLALGDVWRLIASGDLYPDLATGTWVWTDAALEHDDPLTVDVVAQQRLAHLDQTLREIVVATAIAGRCTSVELLAAWTGMPPEMVTTLIDRAVTGRVLIHSRIDEHDRIVCIDNGLRRAALAHLDPHQLETTRHGLATALISVLATDERGDPVPTADQRYGLIELLRNQPSLAHNAHERRIYAHMCSDAARAAHRSAAFQEALDLQLDAIEVLGTEGWSLDPDSTFDLHLHAAQHSLMLGQTSLTDELLDRMDLSQRTATQRVRALRVLGTRSWLSDDPSRALASLRTILAELGEPIPDTVSWRDVLREFATTRRSLLATSPESFLAAPEANDARVRAVLDAMIACVHLAYVDQPMTHMWLVLRGTRLTAEHGLSDGTAYFLTGYGMLTLSIPGGTRTALRYGAVGRELSLRSSERVATMVAFAHEAFVRHWGAPLGSTIAPLTEGYQTAVAGQQRGYGLTGGTFAVLHSLLASQPLGAVEDVAADMSATFAALEERAFHSRVDIVRQAAADLRDGPGDDYVSGTVFDTAAWLDAKARKGELAVIVHTLRGLVALCFDDLEALEAATAAAAPILRTAPGQAVLAQHWFHVAILDALRIERASSRWSRTASRISAERSLQRLRSMARHAPGDVEHRVALIDALMAGGSDGADARVRAMDAFERAVALATANGALHDLGITAERAASFHARLDRVALARHYAAIAHDAWRAWGADAVAQSLDMRLPPAVLLASTTRGLSNSIDSAETPTASDPTSETLAEASSLLGQELEVRDFLGRLIEILMRHTDATRGFLILQSANGPIVEVAGQRTVDGVVDVDDHASTDLDDHRQLCVPAVNYVLRTRQVLSVIDPAADRRFRADSELRDRAPRALLGLPVGRSTATSGVLVLESDTYTHAFEPDRIEALRVLSAQAISAIDQARLSSDLSILNEDVAELRLTASELTARAETDPLTGVSNRAGMEARLHDAIRAANAQVGVSPGEPPVPNAQVGVLFCDLDDFKLVNDRFGHSVGDVALVEIAQRLQSVIRADDIVARIGGDEFVVVSVGVSTAELTRMAERAIEEIARGIEVAPHGAIDVGISIGVGRSDLSDVTSIDDVDALVRVADQAMYEAKGSGKGQVHSGS